MWVATLAAVTMVAEVVGGWLLGSMAVLADGLHMAAHTAAMGIAVFAYAYARRHASSPQFAFGTGKVNALGGYTGATVLGITAIWMIWESLARAWHPTPILYGPAAAVAVLGLVVNGISAWMLHDDHSSGCSHAHDHNLRAAYLHVVADMATSVLAILALIAARQWDVGWIDPAAGLVGAVIVAWWSVGLVKTSASVLLDHQGPMALRQIVRERLEADGAVVSDLRCWAVAPNRYAVAVALRTRSPSPGRGYRERLASEGRIAWMMVEAEEPHAP